MTERQNLLEGLRRTCDALAIEKMGGYEAWVRGAMEVITILDRQVAELVDLVEKRNQLDPVETRDRLAAILLEDHGTDDENA